MTWPVQHGSLRATGYHATQSGVWNTTSQDNYSDPSSWSETINPNGTTSYTSTGGSANTVSGNVNNSCNGSWSTTQTLTFFEPGAGTPSTSYTITNSSGGSSGGGFSDSYSTAPPTRASIRPPGMRVSVTSAACGVRGAVPIIRGRTGYSGGVANRGPMVRCDGYQPTNYSDPGTGGTGSGSTMCATGPDFGLRDGREPWGNGWQIAPRGDSTSAGGASPTGLAAALPASLATMFRPDLTIEAQEGVSVPGLNQSSASSPIPNPQSLIPSLSDALGNTTNLNYDANGNLTSLTDPDGNTTAWTYSRAIR